VLALKPFLDVFVFGIFPEPLLDHVVSGHDSSHPGSSGTLREAWSFPVSVGCVVSGIGSRSNQSDRPDDQRDAPLGTATSLPQNGISQIGYIDLTSAL
jgi:hypothetical protein